MSLLISAGRRRTGSPPSSGPLTGPETNGAISTLAHEAAFWSQVASETALTVTDAGPSSVTGEPIRRVDLGTGPNVVLMTCQRHGFEASPRDAAMAWIRDLAYSTDPNVTSYLAGHRIVLIPTMNPYCIPLTDGVRTQKGLTADGYDLNREPNWTLVAPESETVAAVWADVQPSLFWDLHGWSGSTAQYDLEFLYKATPPGVSATVSDASRLFPPFGVSAAQAAGYTARAYQTVSHYAMSSLVSMKNHVPSMTSEVNTYYPITRQVDTMRAVLDAFPAWHKTNAADLAVARQASLTAATEATTGAVYYATDAYTFAITPADLTGYTLTEPIPDAHAAFWGIQQEPGFVSIDQAARRAIPQLVDPASPVKVVTGARVLAP